MTHLHQPRLSGLGRNPAAPDEVLVRLAAQRAGRHGINLRTEPLSDAVAEAMLRHGGADAAVRMSGDRVSPMMRRRIAEHPDPAIRHGAAGHPNVTEALLDELLYDPEPEVADNAAANPALGVPSMLRILAEEDVSRSGPSPRRGGPGGSGPTGRGG